MTDIVSRAKRSQMMAGIRGKNTRPEIDVRTALHKAGLRYRLHVQTLPGKPDLVFPKFQAVLFIHGCFWHGHECQLFKWPSSREEFWRSKILGNKKNDDSVSKKLLDEGWRVGIIWECSLKGKKKRNFSEVIDKSIYWLRSSKKTFEIRHTI